MSQTTLSYASVYHTLFSWRTTKPVIAAVTGACHNKALTLLGLHTDLRVCGESASFGFPLISRGFGSGDAFLSQLSRQIPYAWLPWMVSVEEPIDAQTAHQCHIVNEIVSDETVFGRARELAEQVAAIDPAITRAEKNAVTEMHDMDYEQGLKFAYQAHSA